MELLGGVSELNINWSVISVSDTCFSSLCCKESLIAENASSTFAAVLQDVSINIKPNANKELRIRLQSPITSLPTHGVSVFFPLLEGDHPFAFEIQFVSHKHYRGMLVAVRCLFHQIVVPPLHVKKWFLVIYRINDQKSVWSAPKSFRHAPANLSVRDENSPRHTLLPKSFLPSCILHPVKKQKWDCRRKIKQISHPDL